MARGRREGTRPIRLFYPEGDSWHGIRVYASRFDRAGRVSDDEAEQRSGEWTTVFVIRPPLGAPRPAADWRLVDEYGEQYVIEAVAVGMPDALIELTATRSVDGVLLT